MVSTLWPPPTLERLLARVEEPHPPSCEGQGQIITCPGAGIELAWPTYHTGVVLCEPTEVELCNTGKWLVQWKRITLISVVRSTTMRNHTIKVILKSDLSLLNITSHFNTRRDYWNTNPARLYHICETVVAGH